jgi:peroxiredoxin Q/BCP
VRDDLSLYQREQIQPFGVNPASAESHAGYAARLGLNFPLLSDPDLAVAGAYGALRPDGRSIARSVVVIGRDGVIRYSQAGAPGAELVIESLR